MSRGNKEEQKWLLGESLNQYDRSLKEELGKVEKRNREQNHKISALINAFDDDYIKKEEENTNIPLDYSKEGIVIVDDIKGNTLVNNVKDSNKELVLNGDIDTQGINNVTLEGTVDNGKVDVSLEGNTEINLSKTKDPIMITHKFDDINSNNGKLQTTVNETTTVNDSPGKVDIKEIAGDTLINHVSNGSKELTLNGDIDTSGYNNVTLTEGINGGKVDVMCEGNTMVNVCDQEDPVAITKSYEVTTGNHVALQGEYDGKCRPNIYGNTLVNLVGNIQSKTYVTVANNEITYDLNNNAYPSCTFNVNGLVNGRTYTLIVDIKKNSHHMVIGGSSNKDYEIPYINKYTTTGRLINIFTIPNDGKVYNLLPMWTEAKNSNKELVVSYPIILEGDYTNKPIPDYFTGMKSSFEDKLVPENLYKFSSRDDFYSLNDNVVLDGEYIKMTANGKYQNAMLKPLATIKPSTTYTVVVDVVENTLNSRLIVTVNQADTQLSSADTFLIPAGRTRIFTRVVTTSDDLSKCIRSLATFLDIDNTTGSIKYRIMVVEGDYTNYDFTNYDSTKTGKYKVDYKVTGKNKVAYTELGDINVSTGENLSNILTMRTSYIFLRANHTYYIANQTVEGSEWFANMNYDKDKNFIRVTYENNTTITPKQDMYLRIKRHNPNQLDWKVQLEESTTATTYEPYKEYTKTLYLNSPLLEGDTIEQSGNDIVHMHNRGQMIIDGTENNLRVNGEDELTNTYRFILTTIDNLKLNQNPICDKYVSTIYNSKNDYECIMIGGSRDIHFRISKNKLTDFSVNSFRKYLQQNPITVVYKLATPTREVISTNDNLLLDSYTNGHLDVGSIVPIDKVEFRSTDQLVFSCKYLYDNTPYIVQFESDSTGIIYFLALGKNDKDALVKQNVVTGLNKFTLSTGNYNSNYFYIDGIGFNASKIVVTPKVDEDFGYFKGMKSVGECEGNKIEILSSVGKENLIKDSNIYVEQTDTVKTFNSSYQNILDKVKNKTITISVDIEVEDMSPRADGKNRIGCELSIIYEDGTVGYHGIWYSGKNFKGRQAKTFSIIKGIKAIDYFGIYVQCAGKKHKIGRPKLEIGDTNTSWCPSPTDNLDGLQTFINKKEILMNEPLRGLPNGVKDKYVIIDGKWYIERNCKSITLDGSEKWSLSSMNNSSYCVAFTATLNSKNLASSNIISNTLPILNSFLETGQRKGIYLNSNNEGTTGNFVVSVPSSECNSLSDLKGIKYWLQNNPTTVVYQVTPTYEPIDYNPFEVYSDTTHISNNSNIPCNMVIKNTGYNTISLKENTKYTAYVNNKNNISLTYKLDNNAIAVNSSNKFTFTTPSTLVDRTIRIASKGNKIENLMIVEETPQNDPIGYFDGLKSSYECEKVTDVNDENYNKYKVDVRVEGENFESTQTVYLNSPLLKGDKIIWKDNKLQHYHKMKTIVFDGSDDESWILHDNQPSDTSLIRFSTEMPSKKTGTFNIMCNKTPINSLDENFENVNTECISGHPVGVAINIWLKKSKLSTQDVAGFKQWLQQNPITVVYELATPYYEEISEYPLKFNSIANCSLSTTSNIQVSNISFNIYEETLPYLYNDKKYYITFNSDISKEIIINLGGTELIYTTKVGFNKVEITTPDNSNNMLTFNGQGVNINNVKVTQQNIDDYFEGMKSVGECEDLEIVSNNNDNTLSNKQTLTHEPLRGLPNGVKDKYVIIDGKWYIERNTVEIDLSTIPLKEWRTWTDNNTEYWAFYAYHKLLKYQVNEQEVNTYCSTRPNVVNMDKIRSQNGIGVHIGCGMVESGGYIAIGFKRTELSPMDSTGLKQWLINNPTKVIAEAYQPTYEPIDYNPFEVYTDITHISNNSIIPCNMVIKNSGYNCILKPNTKYTVVTNTQNSISAKIGSTKVDSTNNVFTIITPSTLTDSVLRFSGKGLTTKNIMLLEGDKTNYIPGYFTGMESAFEQELVTDEKDKNYGKYKVNVKVTDGNKENNITFYINEPLRGIGDIKDKIYVKEDKIVVERNCVSYVIEPTQIPSWASSSNGIYTYNLSVNSPIVNTAYGQVVCNSFPCDVKNAHIRNYANSISTVVDPSVPNGVIRIITDKDSETLKQWLQANPTTVVYQLAEPICEEAECDLSKLMLENYENSSLILNSNIPPTVDVRYKGELPIVSATKELSSNVESTTIDINQNIIPYMCDMDYRIVELQLKNASTQGLEVNVLGLDSEDVLFNNRKANKIFNPSYEMLKRDILSERYSSDEYKYRLERYLLANKISNEEYNELEELINGR